MQDAKKRNRRRFAERRRGLVPEKTSDYSYLYYYNTLRGGMQEQKIERTARKKSSIKCAQFFTSCFV